MLNAPIVLHDVDLEEQCSKIAARYCAKTRTRLSPSELEDLVSYLIFCAWQLGERYDPTTLRSSFRAYINGILAYRCVDWQRKHLGRSVWKWADAEYRRERPQFISLDHPTGDDGADPLVDTLASRAGDGSPDRDTSLSWFHSAGDQQRAADRAILRAEFRRRARDRARRKRAVGG